MITFLTAATLKEAQNASANTIVFPCLAIQKCRQLVDMDNVSISF